ncbi:hypothetical protein DSO57_1031033 [Entomophthora muscae]|uniref:Uncharacterized protein n=1 Tax=Entomophthora muscae TaxID=34485 RepID=A0ACC2S2M7_9FUNG|nr:hypothetical protein DSO57_1031033 [Entomophthora muscae]
MFGNLGILVRKDPGRVIQLGDFQASDWELAGWIRKLVGWIYVTGLAKYEDMLEYIIFHRVWDFG